MPSALDDLRLAVDEAVTNIIVHGYGGPGEITLELSADHGDLVVQLCDNAPAFDSASAAPDKLRPAGQRTTPGGFGLYLMKQAMDVVVYRPLDPGNELTMIKQNVIATP
jgi:anti-sigma regulatory factor (Ser/Thr protein kinase)